MGPIDPAALAGPAAGLVIAVGIIIFLSKLLQDYISHLKGQIKDLTTALTEQAAATNRVADLLDAERQEKLLRRRIQDGKE